MEKKRYDVAIIGGGASGLFLACLLPSTLSIAILEANDRVGKKLLSTGNGKCNLTNLDMNIIHYNKPNYVEDFIDRFDCNDTLLAFENLGLQTKVIDKRVYPYSESATNVLDVLRRGVQKNGVNVLLSHSVESIDHLQSSYTLNGIIKVKDEPNKNFSIDAKNIVLATGSNATFGRNSLHLYKKFGHTIRPFIPALTPLKTEKEPIKGLHGVRVKAGAKLGMRYETGEILFKDFGVSGIAAFNLASEVSRGVAREGSSIVIDFAPDYSLADVENIFSKKASASVGDVLLGLFHSKVQDRIMWAAGVKPEDNAIKNAHKVAKVIKQYPIKIEGLGDQSLSQVMSGGLALNEFDENLMSLRMKNAYAMGEALDVDGDSGGYNLQWAWSSAFTVANAITKKYREQFKEN